MSSKNLNVTDSATSFIFDPFRITWRFFKSAILVWFLCMAMHIIWIRWNHLNADTYMRALIDYYLHHTSDAAYVQTIAIKLHWLAFDATSLQRTFIAPINSIYSDLRVAGFATILYGIKIAIVLLSLPLFVALQVVAIIDGLVQRYIRKACGGNESSALYHRAKRYGLTILPSVTAILFLTAPIAFDPALILLPTAIVSAFFLRMQAKYYKKYL